MNLYILLQVVAGKGLNETIPIAGDIKRHATEHGDSSHRSSTFTGDLYFQANRTQSFQVSNLFVHLNKECIVERLVVGLLKS